MYVKHITTFNNIITELIIYRDKNILRSLLISKTWKGGRGTNMRYSVKEDYREKNPDFEIYINDDFKLNYRFIDHRYSPAVVIPPEYVNFVFTYSIYGRPETYVASNINGVRTNCFIDPATNAIKVIFEHHGLKSGKLIVNQRFIINDPEFPTGKADRHQLIDTGVILKDQLYE